MTFWETILDQARQGNFSFFILIAGILTLAATVATLLVMIGKGGQRV